MSKPAYNPELETAKKESKEGTDFFANTTLSDNSVENVIEENDVDPDSLTLQPKKSYMSNASVKQLAEQQNYSDEDLDAMYKESTKKFNQLQQANTSVKENILNDEYFEDAKNAVAAELYSNIDTDKFGFSDKLAERTTPMQKALLGGYVDPETGERKWLNSALDVAWGTDGTFRMKRQKLADGTDAPTANAYGLYELEAIKNNEAPEYDDVLVSAWNVGFSRGSFMDANKTDEAIYEVLLRQTVKNVPYFIPYLNYVWAAKDLMSGAGHLVRSAQKAVGANTETVDNYNNFFRRFNTGHHISDSPYSLGSIIEGVGDVVGQIKGMSLTAKSVGYLSSGLGANANIAANLGSKVSRLQMSLPASADIAQLAEHHDIDPVHVLGMHALVTAGYMQLGKLTEGLFTPTETKAILNGATKKYTKQLLKGKGFKNAFGFNGTKNVAQDIVNNGKAALQRMAALKESKPAMYKSLLGSLNEGLEETLELGMEESVKQMYNAFNKEKKEGEGRFKDFNKDQFLGEAGVSFFYGALAGGALGTGFAQRHLLGRSKTELAKEQLSDFLTIAQDPTARAEMDKILQNKKSFAHISDKQTFSVDEDGEYQVPDYDSTNPELNMTQRDTIQKMTQADWEYTKSLVDSQLNMRSFQTADGTPVFNSAVEAQYEEYVKKHKLSIQVEGSKLLTEIAEAKQEMEELKDSNPENAEELTTKKAEIEEKIKVAQEALNELYKPETIQDKIEENVYLFSPELNTKSDGTKLFQGDDGFLSFEEFKRIHNDYKAKIGDLKTLATETKALEDEIKATEGVDDMIAKTVNQPVTAETISHVKNTITKGKNALDKNFADGFKAHVIAKYGEDVGNAVYDEQIQGAVLDLADFTDPDFSEDFPDIVDFGTNTDNGKAILGQFDELKTKLRTFNPSVAVTLGTTDMALLGRAVLLDSKGQDVLTKLSDEEVSREENENEYLSNTPMELINDLVKHKTYIRYQSRWLDVLNNFKRLNGQEFLEPDEGNAIKSQYEAIHKELDKALARAVNLQETVTKNTSDAIGSLDARSKEVLDERIKYLSEALTLYFSDPVINGNGIKEALQASLQELTSEDIPFKQAYASYIGIEKQIYDVFNALPKESQKELLSTFRIKGFKDDMLAFTHPAHRFNIFRSIVGMDSFEFLAEFNEVIKDSDTVPTYEQQEAIKEILSNVIINYEEHGGESVFNEVFDKEAKFANSDSSLLKNSIFLNGTWGAGKTSFITGTVLKMLKRYQENNGLSTSKFSKVVAAGPGVEQQQNLRDNLKDHELATENAIDADTLLEDLKNGADTDYLTETGAIIFDEATIIPTETVKAINDALEVYNNSVRKDSLPLQIIYVGDSNQYGTFKVGENYSIREDNISVYKNVYQTSYIAMSVRSKNEPLRNFTTHLRRRSEAPNKVKNENELFEAHWGKTRNGRLAGVNITTSKDEVKRMAGLIKNQNDTSFAYISDKPLDQIPSEMHEFVMHPEKIQGLQRAAVIVDLSDSLMTLNEGYVTKESYALKLLGVSASRAIEFVTVLNGGNRNWKSTELGEGEFVSETDSLMNAENLAKFVPNRKEYIASLLQIVGDASLDLPNIGIQPDAISVTQIAKHIPAEFFEDMQGEVNSMIEDYNSAVSDLDPNSETYAEDFAKLKEEASKKITDYTTTFTEDLNTRLTEEWAEVEEVIGRVNKETENIPAEELVIDDKIYTEPEMVAKRIVDSLVDDSLLLKIPKIESIIENELDLSAREVVITPEEVLPENPDPRKDETVNPNKLAVDSNGEVIMQEGDVLVHTDFKSTKQNPYIIRGNKVYYGGSGGRVFSQPHINVASAFAAIQRGDAKLVTRQTSKVYNQYIVNPKGLIVSLRTGNIMKWGPNHGTAKAIMAEAGYGKPIQDSTPVNQEFNDNTPPPLTPEDDPEGGNTPNEPVQNPIVTDTDRADLLDELNSTNKEYQDNQIKKGRVSAHTWLTHDFNPNPEKRLTSAEMHKIKQEIFDGKDISKYKFSLKVADITDISDADVAILFPEHLRRKANTKIAYIEASWDGDKKMSLATFPYVSDERLAANTKYGVIKEFIENDKFHNLDITPTIKKYWTSGENRLVGRVRTMPNHIHLNQMMEQSGKVSFSKKMFVHIGNANSKKTQQQVFMLYSYRPQAEMDNLINAFITDENFDLAALNAKGVGTIPLNRKVYGSLSHMAAEFSQIGSNHEVSGSKLLSSPQVLALEAHLKNVAESDGTLSSEVEALVKGVLYRINPIETKKGAKMATLNMLSVGKLLSNASSDAVAKFDSIVANTPKLDYNGVPYSNGYKIFTNGIMLHNEFDRQNKLAGSHKGVAMLKLPVTPNNGEMALLEDSEVLSLYQTNVNYISTPDMIMPTSMVDALNRQITEEVNQKDTELNLMNMRKQREEQLASNYILTKDQVTKKLATPILSQEEADALNELINKADISSSRKVSLKFEVAKKLKQSPVPPTPKIKTLPIPSELNNILSQYVDENLEAIVAEDKEAGKVEVMEAIDALVTALDSDTDMRTIRKLKKDLQSKFTNAIEVTDIIIDHDNKTCK